MLLADTAGNHTPTISYCLSFLCALLFRSLLRLSSSLSSLSLLRFVRCFCRLLQSASQHLFKLACSSFAMVACLAKDGIQNNNFWPITDHNSVQNSHVLANHWERKRKNCFSRISSSKVDRFMLNYDQNDLWPPKIWNSIPVHIRQSQTYSAFRRHLKTHYFLSAHLAPCIL